MSIKKKLLQAAAGNAGGEALNVEDVFSTYLYTGNSSTQTITNGIDLDGEGGLVWFKKRDSTYNHVLQDTARGAGVDLYSNLTVAEIDYSGSYGIDSFNSDGFSLIGAGTATNQSGNDYASWTFRKAPKFFDVVTWTGDNVQGRSISHNLGSVPGVIITKKLNGVDNWVVYHRSNGAGKMLYLNSTNASLNNTAVYPTTPTDSVFYVGNDSAVNGTSSDTYVAYLFAHNDGDGEFGRDGDADIIKCGSYTGTGGTQEIDFGFEPQYVLIKRASGAANWAIFDIMRGMSFNNDPALFPNTADSEYTSFNAVRPSPTGLSINNTSWDVINGGGQTYIYIAIRRGTKVPESATEVFAIDTSGATAPTPPAFNSGFPVDMAFHKQTDGSSGFVSSRLTSNAWMALDLTQAETANAGYTFDYQDGWRNNTQIAAYRYSWMWKRAPKFFDVVAYTGDGVAGRTVSHNLTVAPEMIWVKRRNGSYGWTTYHSATTATDYLYLQSTQATETTSVMWNDTEPTSGEFTVGSNATVNSSTDPYIAYLFASLPGISKVGSYTGNDGTQTIDCGFTTGARFILIKRTDGNSDWYVWDTERGINVASDPYLELNTTDAENPGQDEIDAHASGFIINNPGGSGDAEINKSGRTYIFYAIA